MSAQYPSNRIVTPKTCVSITAGEEKSGRPVFVYSHAGYKFFYAFGNNPLNLELIEKLIALEAY